MNLTHVPLRLLITVFLGLVPIANAFADQQDNIAIEKGNQLYLSNKCSMCHGNEGKGDGEDAEAYDPYPTNFHDTKGYHYGYKKEDIIHSIKYGIKDNPSSIMPSFNQLTDQELKEISAYLMSLQEK